MSTPEQKDRLETGESKDCWLINPGMPRPESVHSLDMRASRGRVRVLYTEWSGGPYIVCPREGCRARNVIKLQYSIISQYILSRIAYTDMAGMKNAKWICTSARSYKPILQFHFLIHSMGGSSSSKTSSSSSGGRSSICIWSAITLVK